MTATYHQPLSLYIITFLVTATVVGSGHTLPKLAQKILVGPRSLNVHPGETIQLPCIVSKQADAIVTWCWNDFCTLGKTQLLRQENTDDGSTSVYQYTAYPRFQLSINERLHHYNLSIIHVSDDDEGVFQCQVQRTMQAQEARSERVQLTLITPPIARPILLLPNMPLRQGQTVNITCLSSPSKPASKLILYQNERILTNDLTSSVVSYDMDMKKNRTKLIYTINELDSSWNNVIVRCEQIYQYAKTPRLETSATMQVYYKPKARIESQNRHPLTINSTATFRCIVQGNPEPQFRWFANSIDVTSLTSSTINIPLSKHVHNHSIGCSARNLMGITNTSIRLLIRYPPILIHRPPNFVVLDLERRFSSKLMVVRCIVDSYPRATISWYRHGQLLTEGSSFNLANITKRDQQGTYSYRISTEGFETIEKNFIIYIKGKPLISIEASKEDSRLFICHVYSSTPILRISWRLNDQPIQSTDPLSISTNCDDYSCISKLIYDNQKLTPSSKTLNHVSCIGENDFGIEQSRLYQVNNSNDPSMIFVLVLLSIFVLIILFSIVALYCCCRVRHIRKKQYESQRKKLPVVYDEHYSINELIKEVGSLRTCKTSSNNTDQLSFQIESTDHLLTTLFNSNTKKLLDNFSNESSTNSSGCHSKSTTTIFNNDYSPRFTETIDSTTFSGPSAYEMNV